MKFTHVYQANTKPRQCLRPTQPLFSWFKLGLRGLVCWHEGEFHLCLQKGGKIEEVAFTSPAEEGMAEGHHHILHSPSEGAYAASGTSLTQTWSPNKHVWLTFSKVTSRLKCLNFWVSNLRAFKGSSCSESRSSALCENQDPAGVSSWAPKITSDFSKSWPGTTIVLGFCTANISVAVVNYLGPP